jgi:hypothetical protein
MLSDETQNNDTSSQEPGEIDHVLPSEGQDEDSRMAEFNESDDRFGFSNEGDSEELSLVPAS